MSGPAGRQPAGQREESRRGRSVCSQRTRGIGIRIALGAGSGYSAGKVLPPAEGVICSGLCGGHRTRARSDANDVIIKTCTGLAHALSISSASFWVRLFCVLMNSFPSLKPPAEDSATTCTNRLGFLLFWLSAALGAGFTPPAIASLSGRNDPTIAAGSILLLAAIRGLLVITRPELALLRWLRCSQLWQTPKTADRKYMPTHIPVKTEQEFEG